jgi:hypothetical protein
MNFIERLNGIEKRITEEGFLQRKGLGNEIPFYVFDYPPEEELKMREYISFILERMNQQHAHIRLLHIKLFDLMVQHLRERGNLDKAFTLEAENGSQALWDALSASVKPDRFIGLLDEKNHLAEYDIIFISGVGTIWPWVRAHSLLNNLQSVTGNASVVLFYPGVYTGQSFKLFDRLETNNYYRAFRLVP